MKNLNIKLLLFACLLFTVSIGCGGDDGGLDDCTSVTLSENIQDELNDINQAVTQYSNDPSDANCQNLKNAYQDYIDELRRYEDCYISLGQSAEYNQSLNEAESSIDSIC